MMNNDVCLFYLYSSDLMELVHGASIKIQYQYKITLLIYLLLEVVTRIVYSMW